jgi:hypothetical protein
MIQYLNRPSKTVNEIVHKMRACALGNTRKTINFSTYNPKWKEAFDWLESKIASEFKDILLPMFLGLYFSVLLQQKMSVIFI